MGRTVNGRVVLITGGAGGIGLATARALLAAGARVAIGDVDAGALQRATAAHDLLGLRLDVTDRSSFTAAIDEVEARLGGLDALVNNAGIMPVGEFVDESDEVARRMFEINVHGVLIGCKVVLPRMRMRGRGHIVNVASSGGYTSLPGVVTYCGSKHAVVGITSGLRAEVAGTGVEVSAILPAFVDTPLTSGTSGPRLLPKVQPEEVADAIVSCLRRPRAEVFVPAVVGPGMRLTKVLPTAVNDLLRRATGGDELFRHVDAAARAGYEARARRDA